MHISFRSVYNFFFLFFLFTQHWRKRFSPTQKWLPNEPALKNAYRSRWYSPTMASNATLITRLGSRDECELGEAMINQGVTMSKSSELFRMS